MLNYSLELGIRFELILSVYGTDVLPLSLNQRGGVELITRFELILHGYKPSVLPLQLNQQLPTNNCVSDRVCVNSMRYTLKRNCLQCNEEFDAEERYIKRGHAKFCSRTCASRYNNLKNSKRSIPNCNCALCGKQIYKNDYKKKISVTGLFFCCKEHKDIAQSMSGGVQEYLPSHYGKGTGISTYRDKAIKIKGAKCEVCGWDKNINGITVHHKDRNRLNNNIDNLSILCACCHAIEHFSK